MAPQDAVDAQQLLSEPRKLLIIGCFNFTCSTTSQHHPYESKETLMLHYCEVRHIRVMTVLLSWICCDYDKWRLVCLASYLVWVTKALLK